jgi:hypothetical protein
MSFGARCKYDNLDIPLLRFSFLILRTKHHLFLDSLRLLPLANLVAHPSTPPPTVVLLLYTFHTVGGRAEAIIP